MKICTVKCNMVINGIIDKSVSGVETCQVDNFFDADSMNGASEFVFYQWPEDSIKGTLELEKIWQKIRTQNSSLIVVTDVKQSLEVKDSLGDIPAEVITQPLDIDKIKAVIFAKNGLDKSGRKGSLKSKVFKADYINPFIESTINVISQISGVTPVKKGVTVNSPQELVGDISGVIGLAGVAEGFLIMVFKRGLAEGLVSRMLSIDVEGIEDDDVRDGVGELANMVSGNAKAALVGTPYHFQLSLPTVVIGSAHTVAHPPDIPCITVEFEALDESFLVAVALVTKEESK